MAGLPKADLFHSDTALFLSRQERCNPLFCHFSRTSSASAGERPARAASQQATGAAKRSEAWAAAPASLSRSLICSSLGASTPNTAAKPASHSLAVIHSTSFYAAATASARAASASALAALVGSNGTRRTRTFL